MNIRHPMVLALCVMGWSISVAEPLVLPGAYEAEGGWGTLTIQNSGHFKLSTLGGNAHSCELKGRIRGNQGIGGGKEAGDSICIVHLEPMSGAIKVTPETPDTCSEYCGTRASLDGTYHLPSPSCTPDTRKARKAAFLKAYAGKQYPLAYDHLTGLTQDCGRFFNWIERDRLTNDLAVTLLHLDKKPDCLGVLQSTLGWKNKTPEELEGNLAPSDFDNYLPVAKATWTNIKLCRS